MANRITEEFIDNLNDQYNQIMAIEKKKRLDPVLCHVKSFIKQNDCILYGGTAINMHLSKRNKFYNNTDIPDYDAYTLNAKEKSIDLANMLKTENYDHILIKNAIHSGTFKASWKFNDISDMTDIYDYEFKIIKKNSKLIDGVSVVSKILLKCNSYYELSMPKSCLFRWSKVYKRLSLLELEDTPIKTSLDDVISNLHNKPLPNLIESIVNEINAYTLQHQLPMTGFAAIKHYLNIKQDSIHLHDKYPLIQVLSMNMEKTKKDILSILTKYSDDINFTVINSTKSSFFPDKLKVQIMYMKKQYNIVSIIDSKNNCFGTLRPKQTNKKTIYASILFIIYQLYFNLFKHENNKSKINELNIKLISLLRDKIEKKLIGTSCYGYNETLSAKKINFAREGKPIVIYNSERKEKTKVISQKQSTKKV